MNAYREGKDAAMHGVREEDNPYEEGTDDYEQWLEGYYFDEAVEKIHKGKPEWQ